MKVTIESTADFIEGPCGVPARVWTGTTGQGHKVTVLTLAIMSEKGNEAALRELAADLNVIVPELGAERLAAMMELGDKTGKTVLNDDPALDPPPWEPEEEMPEYQDG